jgi:hypothetical protein
MDATSVIQSVKDRASGARDTIQRVAAHSPAVIKSGKQTLRAAREVVATAKRDAKTLAVRTKDDLKRTLQEGAAEIGDRLSRLATPTRKEMAEARKQEIKAKKQSRRSQAHDDEEGSPPESHGAADAEAEESST